MNRNGPIIIIEDDEDDQEIFKEAYGNLNYSNELIFFTDGNDALNFLQNSTVIPFFILSDLNMPKINGFELREKLELNAELNKKSIPYLFFTTASSRQSVIDAYSMSVQGFFVKQGSIAELEETITAIMEYWKRCAAPNNFPMW